ncbi:hypothetical protein [Nocardia yamanashiensis]|nr:hypothetical protein [Nocardia yamanashiensis]
MLVRKTIFCPAYAMLARSDDLVVFQMVSVGMPELLLPVAATCLSE